MLVRDVSAPSLTLLSNLHPLLRLLKLLCVCTIHTRTRIHTSLIVDILTPRSPTPSSTASSPSSSYSPSILQSVSAASSALRAM